MFSSVDSLLELFSSKTYNEDVISIERNCFIMEYDKQGIAERLKKPKEVLRMNVNNLTDTEVQQPIL